MSYITSIIIVHFTAAFSIHSDVSVICFTMVPSHGAGQDFDMTEYEVLSFDQCDTKEPLSHPITPPEPMTEPTPPLTIQPSLPSPPPSPAPPATEQTEDKRRGGETSTSSPQLRLIKRKGPEVLF